MRHRNRPGLVARFGSGRDSQAHVLDVRMCPEMALRTLAQQMCRYDKFVPEELNTTDKYLSHPATYYHLGAESSRRGITSDVQFGLLVNPLPEGPDQEEAELIATQIEEEVTAGAATQAHSARRTGAGTRGTPWSAPGAGTSHAGSTVSPAPSWIPFPASIAPTPPTSISPISCVFTTRYRTIIWP